MIFVSNTSPIMNLAAVGRLDILEKLYIRVLIPEAVFTELKTIDANDNPSLLIQSFPFVEPMAASDRPLVTSLALELHIGEAEAIALAIETKAELLLMDERIGRKKASSLGLQVIGLLGVLMAAKQQGVINEIKPLLDTLVSKAGFWISTPLYSLVLEKAGEYSRFMM